MIDRRHFLASLLAMAGAPAWASQQKLKPRDTARIRLGGSAPFSLDALRDDVRRLAAQDYVEPPKVPEDWIDLTYDQYRGIGFKHTAALWHGATEPFELQFFPPGLYFPYPISVNIVSEGSQQPVLFDKKVFSLTDQVPRLSESPTLDYSGFRLHGFLTGRDSKSEIAVFQGASYFRAVGRDHIYGLSARGLAINTGDADGEEFPAFKKFWVEAPDEGAKQVKLHALLDSPSVAGLYTFVIRPGATTEMDVTATLYPRRDMAHVGIGAGTSMFLFDETNRSRFDDFRPSVHDSDGLLIENGAGEVLWRKLANPSTLQISSFVDQNPRGFGLMQRSRRFSDFADLEASYHRRPGLWVIPGEDWGAGSVTLVEIPADKEIYDNIVAYWRPKDGLSAGEEHRFTYRLLWCSSAPRMRDVARVTNTRMGKRVFEQGYLATIDFEPHPLLPDDAETIKLHVSANGGKVSEGILQKNPDTQGYRLGFTFDPEDRKSVELRAQLMVGSHSVSEVWLYRWTA